VIALFRGFTAGIIPFTRGNPLFSAPVTTLEGGSVPLTSEPTTLVGTFIGGGSLSIDVNDQRIVDYGYAALGSYSDTIDIGGIRIRGELDPARGHYVIGQLTTPDTVQDLSGSATYTGQLAGTTIGGEEVGGVINLTADFDTARLGGELQVQRNGTPWLNATTSSLSLVTGEEDISYSGQLHVEGGGDGTLQGILYGENAQGTGGSWSIDNVPDNIVSANGVFLAQTGEHVEILEIPEPTFSREPIIVGRAVEYRSRTARQIFQNNFFAASSPIDINEDNTLISPNAGLDAEYDYASYGSWSRPDRSSSFNPIRANYVIGPSTVPEDMPRTGSAVFVGEMDGYGVSTTLSPLSGPNTRGFQLEGDIHLNANFENSTIGGSYELRRANGDLFNSGDITQTNIQAQQNSVGFSSTFSSGSSTYGSIDGTFFGPRAEEVGGSWDVGNGARGVYRARQLQDGEIR